MNATDTVNIYNPQKLLIILITMIHAAFARIVAQKS